MSVRAALRRYRSRIGRRSVFLFIVGCVWLVYGGNLVSDLAPYHAGRGLDLLGLVADGLPFALAWLATGAIALVSACVPRSNTIGYTAIVIMPVIRVITYVTAWVQSLTDSGYGYPRGYASAVVWALVAGIIMLTAGWPDTTQAR